jgi:hypothetical protein
LFLIVVSITERILAKFCAALFVLNCPDIFCLTFTLRIALSDALLSARTSSMNKKSKQMLSFSTHTLVKGVAFFWKFVRCLFQKIIKTCYNFNPTWSFFQMPPVITGALIFSGTLHIF